MKDPNSLPQDPMLAELVKMSRRKTLTRRTALAGAAGVGAALGLAACAPAGDGGGATSEGLVPATDVSDSEKVLVWYNWPGYMDLSEDELSKPTLERFQEQSGITVEYLEEYNDNDEWYGINRNELIAGKDVGADLLCPTDWQAELNGRIVLISEMRDSVGVIAQAKGIDITSASSFTEDAFNGVIDDIAALYADGKIKAFAGNEYMDGFANDEYVAGIVWSGDVVQMNFGAGFEKYGFFIPETGGTISSDMFTVPMGATHKKNAELLMNYYYDPVNAAELAAYVNYITPVVGAYEEAIKLDPELAENKLIFPDEAFLASTHGFRALSAQEEQSFVTAWGRVQLGA